MQYSRIDFAVLASNLSSAHKVAGECRTFIINSTIVQPGDELVARDALQVRTARLAITIARFGDEPLQVLIIGAATATTRQTDWRRRRTARWSNPRWW